MRASISSRLSGPTPSVLRFLVLLAIAGVCCGTMLPQTPSSPASAASAPSPAAAPQLTTSQRDHIQVAVQQWQMLQQAQQELTQKLQAQGAEVNKRISDTRKELHLDDTWEFNFQSGDFQKKSAAKPGNVSPAAAAAPKRESQKK